MNILWRSGCNPKQSGDYLVLYRNEAGRYHFAELGYSAKYNAWNSFDCLEEPSEQEKKSWNVLFWVPVAEVIPDMLLEEEVQ